MTDSGLTAQASSSVPKTPVCVTPEVNRLLIRLLIDKCNRRGKVPGYDLGFAHLPHEVFEGSLQREVSESGPKREAKLCKPPELSRSKPLKEKK